MGELYQLSTFAYTELDFKSCLKICQIMLAFWLALTQRKKGGRKLPESMMLLNGCKQTWNLLV